MKKIRSLFTVTILALLGATLSFAQNQVPQQTANPPLLMPQTPAPPLPLAGNPGPVPVAPAPGPPALPAGAAGIPVVQTIPTATLLTHLQQAVATVEKLNRLLAPGKVWAMRAPAGETDIKGGVVYQGAVVAVLHFNPLDGTILPLGVNPHCYQNTIGIQAVKANLASAIGRLKIRPVAEFMEPEACWSFPLTSGNTVVAHIKIYYDGLHVLTDYAANQEMVFYGQ